MRHSPLLPPRPIPRPFTANDLPHFIVYSNPPDIACSQSRSGYRVARIRNLRAATPGHEARWGQNAFFKGPWAGEFGLVMRQSERWESKKT
ncbi:hypothetical protein BHU62_00500 [Serratia marcescens]|uniref:Uncharacterized protein n=1 Tax=Serratia marcescens TaxID=615 RepID=A0A1Q4P628_SERMA|nr:hypothetical protein BHU62_00500 [Serratia marcescens]